MGVYVSEILRYLTNGVSVFPLIFGPIYDYLCLGHFRMFVSKILKNSDFVSKIF